MRLYLIIENSNFIDWTSQRTLEYNILKGVTSLDKQVDTVKSNSFKAITNIVYHVSMHNTSSPQIYHWMQHIRNHL